MSEKIRVDIWSDIACPWCYLGKHRFEAGVAAFQSTHPEVEFEVEGHSYELAPDTPVDFAGSEVEFLVQHKGMPEDQVQQMLGQMTELASSEGITFDFGRVRHANTARAHRVLHLAKDKGVQLDLQERLYRAYFAEGADMSDPETLARLGAEVGLDSAEVLSALDDEQLGEAVAADITRARMMDVSGVPFFLIEQKYGVSGAQSAEAFVGAFEQVLELQRSTTADNGSA